MKDSSTRYLESQIEADLRRKMVFLGGPRQVGKTTVANALLAKQPGWYMNWDFDLDRDQILSREWPSGSGLLVLDEVHKYRQWRNTVKGLFDKRRKELQILVTGSARLDFYRFSGDSLQGRYHFLRLHPLSVAELKLSTPQDFEQLLELSGFPEPFFSGSQRQKKRWAIEYRSRLVRDDLRDLERVTELGTIERLAQRLPELVGSPLSLNGLREDLQVSHQSVSRWCEALERLYYMFRLYPIGGTKIRAVKKEAKHYHYDWSLVKDLGARFENLVASHLLKWTQFELDVNGRELELRYFRDTDGREVDFVITEDGNPLSFIECKMADKVISRHLKYLKAKYPKVESMQLVKDSSVDFVSKDGIRVVSALNYLKGLHC